MNNLYSIYMFNNITKEPIEKVMTCSSSKVLDDFCWDLNYRRDNPRELAKLLYKLGIGFNPNLRYYEMYYEIAKDGEVNVM